MFKLIYAFSVIYSFHYRVMLTIRKGGHLLELLVGEVWWIVLFLFALGTLAASFSTYAFVELPAYLIYFASVGVRHWRKNKKDTQQKARERSRMAVFF
jgi:hypothetical protein